MLQLFGEGFAVGYPLLLILCAAQVASVMAGSAGLFLDMTRHQATTARIVGFVAIIHVAISAGFTLVFGAVGTAVSLLLTSILWNLLLTRESRRLLGLDPSVRNLFGSKRGA